MKTAKKEKERKKKLSKQVKKGNGPTAASITDQMQFSDDEEKEHDKVLFKQKEE